MKLLRKELLLLQSQLLFERHKCELHATRNRRLVGKVFQANAIREELVALVNIRSVLCKQRLQTLLKGYFTLSISVVPITIERPKPSLVWGLT